MHPKNFLTILLFVFISREAFAQDSSNIQIIPAKFLDQASARANSLEKKLDKKTDRIIQKMMKQEERMKRRLSKIDSIKAKSIFYGVYEKYKHLEQRLNSGGKLNQYLPKLDTLCSSLIFLQSNSQFLSKIQNSKGKVQSALKKMEGVQVQLQKAEEIQRFLRERKQFLKEQLSKFGFVKDLKKLNKRTYYYSQQINEYKELLKDSKKAESKALDLLSKTKLFQDFMKKNSMLASLFPMSGNSQPSQAGFTGLQTRAQMNSFLQQIGTGSPNIVAQFQQNIQDASSQLTQLRNKISQAGRSNEADLDMPDFKPNLQKTKSFFKRLEYSTSIQSQKATRFFPTTTDVGLSVGYKLNEKSVIGIGASYKLGLGTGWNKIRLTHEGIGIRSFIDMKIKGSFWLSGGYEQNYRSVFRSIGQLRDLSAWQQSGLLGLSKVVSLKTKFLKKTKLQLLWDFLSDRQKPPTQPLLFRIGYSF